MAHAPFPKWLLSLEKARIKLFGLFGPSSPLNWTVCVVYQCLGIVCVQRLSPNTRTLMFLSGCNYWDNAKSSPFDPCGEDAPQQPLIRTLSLHPSTLEKGACALHALNFKPLQSLRKHRINDFASRAHVRVCGGKNPHPPYTSTARFAPANVTHSPGADALGGCVP